MRIFPFLSSFRYAGIVGHILDTQFFFSPPRNGFGYPKYEYAVGDALRASMPTPHHGLSLGFVQATNQQYLLSLIVIPPSIIQTSEFN